MGRGRRLFEGEAKLMKTGAVVLNAFQMVPPKGVLQSCPRVSVALGSVGALRVLDRNGHLNAPLAMRTYGGIVIENKEVGLRNALRRQALIRGGL